MGGRGAVLLVIRFSISGSCLKIVLFFKKPPNNVEKIRNKNRYLDLFDIYNTSFARRGQPDVFLLDT